MWNHFSNFGKGALEKHFCEITLQSGHWHGRCQLKVFSIFSSGGHFVQRSGTILAILVEGHSRSIPVKLFQTPLTGLGEAVSQVNC